MNQIYCGGLTFDDAGQGKGKILDGSFYISSSLAEDELSIDTLDFTVRYPLDGTVDTKPITLPYGALCVYFRDSVVVGTYYLKKVERLSRYDYSFSCQSSIGLLDDTMHYGGIYQGDLASDVIADIIGGKIGYTIKPIFSKIKLYGWLPVANRRENLKQVLFAVGGCAKRTSSDIYISTLDTTTPIEIPDSRVLEGGKIHYDTLVSRVEVTEHGYTKAADTEPKKVFEGELNGQNFTTPKGFEVRNAAIVTWNEPVYDLQFEGCEVLNDEHNANYAVVRATPHAIVKGKPYIHTETIRYKDKPNYKGKEKIASVKDATLISLANSGSTAERVLAYYGNSNTLSTAIVVDNETTTDTIALINQFGDRSTGFIQSMDGNMSSNVTTADVDVVLNYKPPVVVGSRTLVSIKITKPPKQVNYASGDYFDATGMVVTAYYDDGSTDDLNSYNYTPTEVLTPEDKAVTISYTELGVTCTAKQPISVVTLLRRIVIETPPDNTAYYEGDVFDTTGMVVKAYYSDGSTKIVPKGEYTYFPDGELVKGTESITITYTDTGVTAHAYQDITVGNAPNLVSIAVTKPPKQVKYKLGQFFSTEGMIVTAYFDNDTNKPVAGYSYSPAGALKQDDKLITISYTKGNATRTTTTPIEVIYLSSIAITQPPTYTEYYEGNNFNKAGMEVTATYSDGSTAVLDEEAYTVTPTSLVCNDTQVVISYTEQGINATAIQPIRVTYYPYDYVHSKVISTSGTYHLSDLGATHRNLRIISIGGGPGGMGGMHGQAGTSGSSSIIRTGGTGSESGPQGDGGQGGIGGQESIGGMFYATDVVLDTADDDIVIHIGAGGAGGKVADYNQDGTLNPGAAGEATTCTIGNLIITSGDGSANDQGYTDTFTQATYAQKGSAGKDGEKGGNGGSQQQRGYNGTDIPPQTGGTGGGGNRYNRRENPIESQPPRWSQHQESWQEIARRGDLSQSWRGATGFTSDSRTGVIKLWSNTMTIGWEGKYWTGPSGTKYKTYKRGTVYTNVRNDNANDKSDGIFYSYVDEINCMVDGAHLTEHSGTRQRTVYNYRVYVYKEHPRTKSAGTGGGGGGGASASNNGANGGGASTTSAGGGGAGGAGLVPTAPTVFGSAGNAGSGGGGGGGGGGTFASISGDNSYQKTDMWISGGSGGSGGVGSDGSNGAQGCVIIYYS